MSRTQMRKFSSVPGRRRSDAVNFHTSSPHRVAGTILTVAALFVAAFSAKLLAGESSADWVDVTNNVGGEKWGGYGVHYMAAVPGSNVVIAGVSERGLWATADEGATWKKLGGDEIRNRPDRIVFDPKDSSVFWV